MQYLKNADTMPLADLDIIVRVTGEDLQALVSDRANLESEDALTFNANGIRVRQHRHYLAKGILNRRVRAQFGTMDHGTFQDAIDHSLKEYERTVDLVQDSFKLKPDEPEIIRA